MCHPISWDIPLPSGYDQRRRFGLVMVASKEQQLPSKVAAAGGAGGRGTVTKKCVFLFLHRDLSNRQNLIVIRKKNYTYIFLIYNSSIQIMCYRKIE